MQTDYEESQTNCQYATATRLARRSVPYHVVSICFQKVAADILGIKLTRPDLDKEPRIVNAEIVNYISKESSS
ncbi:hypothetical protein LSAT2_028562, partial [Lamellibrachia satsuma]